MYLTAFAAAAHTLELVLLLHARTCWGWAGSQAHTLLQGETSFEEDILNRTPCEVHTFDPTLDSEKRARVERVPAIHLHDYGLGAEDGRATMGAFDAEIKTLPTILGTSLYPLYFLMSTQEPLIFLESFDCSTQESWLTTHPTSANQCMADVDFPLNCVCPADELQIHWVDLLKVDVEGAEWKVLESTLDYYNGQLPFTQLQVCNDYRKSS